MDFIFADVIQELKINYLKKINIINKTYFRNQVITNQGDTCDHIGFINSGSVVVKKVFHDNHEILLYFLGKNDIFGHNNIFLDNNVHQYQQVSLSHTHISFISRVDLEYLLSNDTSIAKNLLKRMSQELNTINDSSLIHKQSDTLSKLSTFLYLEFLKHNCISFSLSLNKTLIATHLKTTRSDLSKGLKYLIDNKIICNVGYAYTILDLDSLTNNIK